MADQRLPTGVGKDHPAVLVDMTHHDPPPPAFGDHDDDPCLDTGSEPLLGAKAKDAHDFDHDDDQENPTPNPAPGSCRRRCFFKRLCGGRRKEYTPEEREQCKLRAKKIRRRIFGFAFITWLFLVFFPCEDSPWSDNLQSDDMTATLAPSVSLWDGPSMDGHYDYNALQGLVDSDCLVDLVPWEGPSKIETSSRNLNIGVGKGNVWSSVVVTTGDVDLPTVHVHAKVTKIGHDDDEDDEDDDNDNDDDMNDAGKKKKKGKFLGPKGQGLHVFVKEDKDSTDIKIWADRQVREPPRRKHPRHPRHPRHPPGDGDDDGGNDDDLDCPPSPPPFPSIPMELIPEGCHLQLPTTPAPPLLPLGRHCQAQQEGGDHAKHDKHFKKHLKKRLKKLKHHFKKHHDQHDRGGHGSAKKFCAQVELEIVLPKTWDQFGRLTVGGVVLSATGKGLSGIAFEELTAKSVVGDFSFEDEVFADSFAVAVIDGQIHVDSIAPAQETSTLLARIGSSTGSVHVNAKVNHVHHDDDGGDDGGDDDGDDDDDDDDDGDDGGDNGLSLGGKKKKKGGHGRHKQPRPHIIAAQSLTGKVRLTVESIEGEGKKVVRSMGEGQDLVIIKSTSWTGSVHTSVSVADDQQLIVDAKSTHESTLVEVSDNYQGDLTVASLTGTARLSVPDESKSTIILRKDTPRSKVGVKLAKKPDDGDDGGDDDGGDDDDDGGDDDGGDDGEDRASCEGGHPPRSPPNGGRSLLSVLSGFHGATLSFVI